MFEVIICKVRTGQVERKVFETHAEATAYLALREAKLLTPRRAGHAPRARGDFRFELRRLEAVVMRPVVVRGLAA